MSAAQDIPTARPEMFNKLKVRFFHKLRHAVKK